MRNHLALVVALALAPGCDNRPQPDDTGPAYLSISVNARNEIPGVQKLTLMVHPSHLMEDCERTAAEYRSTCVQGVSNFRFITDREGTHNVVKLPGAPCPGTTAAPNDYRCWASEKDLTLLDTLAGIPLPTAYITIADPIEPALLPDDGRAFSSVLFNTWGFPEDRDSYIWLSDGRECEVQPVFPPGDLPTQVGSGSFPLVDFSIRRGERWLIKLVVDLGMIDPELCATNQQLRITPVSATAELLSGSN
jgi:hypothetical protein